MEDKVIRFQGLLELSVFVFFIGLIMGSSLLIIIGGLLMVINDILAIYVGALNPLFPVILAVILAVLIQPWYMGVFWSSAVFAVLGVPMAFKKIFKGKSVL